MAYLFQNPNRLFDRDDVIDRFWTDEDRIGAKSALNSTASRLRRALKAPDLLDQVELRSDKWSLGIFVAQANVTDTGALAGVLASLQSGDGNIRTHYDRVSQLYRGDFMPGHSNRWTVVERERLLSIYVRAVLLIIDRLLAEGAHDEATDGCRAILAHDPLRESAHRRLMILRALRGEGACMRRHFQQLQKAVRSECNAPPTRRTQALYDALCLEPSQHELDDLVARELSHP